MLQITVLQSPCTTLLNFRDVTVFFERTGTNTWSWSAVTDGGAIEGATVPDDQGQALEISSGTRFDGDGKLINMTEAATATAWNWPGAEPFSPIFRWD